MFIDISYPLKTDMAIYPNNPSFSIEKVTDIESGDSATISRICMGSHTGTHIDAPAHFIKGGVTLDQIPLERMKGLAKVLDLTGIGDITPDVLMKYDIMKDDIILMKTDNSLNWNCDRILDDYVTLTYDAADYLADKQIKLVGIDYMTIERPRYRREIGKSIHKTLLSQGMLICESLRMNDTEEEAYEFICVPLRIEKADGCPVRCALVI